MALYPYLNFGGNCREAFTRYQEIFGGELDIMAMKDMPPGEADDLPPEAADMVMHAALRFGEDDLLMASDDPTGGFHGAHGMYVNLSLADVAEAERAFGELAEGGEVTMPMGETFWAKRFGMCTDRFGTPWMVNVDKEQG